MQHLVFVYGTLRRGFGNNCLLSNAQFVSHAFTAEKYTMTAGGIPFVSKRPTCQIVGELYRVDDKTLESLDALEGHPRWYKREEIWVHFGADMPVMAWIYFNEREADFLVESGDYAQYRRNEHEQLHQSAKGT